MYMYMYTLTDVLLVLETLSVALATSNHTSRKQEQGNNDGTPFLNTLAYGTKLSIPNVIMKKLITQ